MTKGNGIDFDAIIGDVALQVIGRGKLNQRDSTKYEMRFGTHGSLSVKIAGENSGTWYDHEAKHGGGTLDLVCAYQGCKTHAEAADWIKKKVLNDTPPRIVATYDYRDADNNLLFQVVRFEPTTFRQRRPDPSKPNGWNWSTKGVLQVPYRLPELLAKPDATVFIPEGEKHVDRLIDLGLSASCNAMGAGKWPDALNEWFKKRDVVILPDNDEPGIKHSALVAYNLYRIGARVRILNLPDLREKEDIIDWLDKGGTIDELLTLAETIPDWQPHSDNPPPREEPSPNEETEPETEAEDWFPTIEVKSGKRHEAADAGMDALINAGVPIYQRGPKIVYVARFPAKSSNGDDILTPSILPVPTPLLARYLGQVAIWQKYDGRAKKLVRIDPPKDVVSQISEMPDEWRFNPLAGIISTQTLRPDGTILDKPGYDPATGLVLFEPPKMPLIPNRPSKDQAIKALAFLDELLDEFPFAGDTDEAKKANRAVALSSLMTPVLRGALNPAVPLHAAKSPHPGSGKSYLADCASAIATGEICPVIGRAPTEAEMEKRLHTAAMKGQSIIGLDNINGVLSSEFLCQLVERPLLLVRVLGISDDIKIANTFTVFTNGNNIEIAGDLVRRTIQCSLDPSMERPETRVFKRNPVKTILANRGKYVASVLLIARAYVCAGKPEKLAPYMSFDAWNELVRGSLLWLGCGDPITTVADIAKVDPVRERRTAIFRVIANLMVKKSSPNGFTTGELVSAAEETDSLHDYTNRELRASLFEIAGGKDGRINSERLGWWLRRATNQVASDLKLVRDDTGSRTRWRVVDLKQPA